MAPSPKFDSFAAILYDYCESAEDSSEGEVEIAEAPKSRQNSIQITQQRFSLSLD
jgi:hypothetical protein